MLIDKYVDSVVSATQKHRSERFKAIATLIGGLTFLIVIPALLLLAGYAAERYVLVQHGQSIRIIVSWIAIGLGLFFVGWTTFVQVAEGRGTPTPMAPTERLIVSGPYRLCRNPIQLGAMVYYFGLGSLIASVEIGSIMFGLSFVLGSCYHKFFEEKELYARFGKEYEEYKAKTPFLIPRWPW